MLSIFVYTCRRLIDLSTDCRYGSGAQMVSHNTGAEYGMSGLKWEKVVCPYNTPVRCNPVTSGGRCTDGLNPNLLEGGVVPPLKHKDEDVTKYIQNTLWDPYGPMRVPLLLIVLVVGLLRGWFAGWLAYLRAKRQRGDQGGGVGGLVDGLSPTGGNYDTVATAGAGNEPSVEAAPSPSPIPLGVGRSISPSWGGPAVDESMAGDRCASNNRRRVWGGGWMVANNPRRADQALEGNPNSLCVWVWAAPALWNGPRWLVLSDGERE